MQWTFTSQHVFLLEPTIFKNQEPTDLSPLNSKVDWKNRAQLFGKLADWYDQDSQQNLQRFKWSARQFLMLLFIRYWISKINFKNNFLWKLLYSKMNFQNIEMHEAIEAFFWTRTLIPNPSPWFWPGFPLSPCWDSQTVRISNYRALAEVLYNKAMRHQASFALRLNLEKTEIESSKKLDRRCFIPHYRSNPR